MEKNFLKYTLLLVIFFVGLSMGVSYQENSKSNQLQDDLRDFEDDITNPNNDYDDDDDEFVGVDPTEYDKSIENNVFTSIAKDGEYVIKKIISLVFEKSDDFVRVIFR